MQHSKEFQQGNIYVEPKRFNKTGTIFFFFDTHVNFEHNKKKLLGEKHIIKGGTHNNEDEL